MFLRLICFHGSSELCLLKKYSKIHEDTTPVAMSAEQTMAELRTRLGALKLLMNSNKIPHPRPGMGDRNIARALLDMETFVNTLMKDPSLFRKLSRDTHRRHAKVRH